MAERPNRSVYRLTNVLSETERHCRGSKRSNAQVVILPTVPHLGYPPFYDANNPALLESEIQTYTQLLGSAEQQLEQQNGLPQKRP